MESCGEDVEKFGGNEANKMNNVKQEKNHKLTFDAQFGDKRTRLQHLTQDSFYTGTHTTWHLPSVSVRTHTPSSLAARARGRGEISSNYQS